MSGTDFSLGRVILAAGSYSTLVSSCPDSLQDRTDSGIANRHAKGKKLAGFAKVSELGKRSDMASLLVRPVTDVTAERMATSPRGEYLLQAEHQDRCRTSNHRFQVRGSDGPDQVPPADQEGFQVKVAFHHRIRQGFEIPGFLLADLRMSHLLICQGRGDALVSWQGQKADSLSK